MILFAGGRSYALSPKDISAKSAVLIEQKTGKIIFAKNENERLPMASTTKIMTALIALENIPDMSSKIKIPESAAKTEGSSMYLQAGEIMSYLDLLYGLLLVSGNDAAAALSQSVFESEEIFIAKMNGKAAALGLQNTNFTNPSGLPDDNHYTTALELGLITKEAYNNPVFEAIASTKKYRASLGEKPGARYLTNHNRLLDIYPYAIGVKTGFTKTAGRCLVSAGYKDGVKLIAVTINAPDDWDDHVKMLDYGFDSTALKEYVVPGQSICTTGVTGGVSDTVTAANTGAVLLPGFDDIDYDIKACLPGFVYAPVKKGDVLGSLNTYYMGQIIDSAPLTAQHDVEARIMSPKKKPLIQKIIEFFI